MNLYALFCPTNCGPQYLMPLIFRKSVSHKAFSAWRLNSKNWKAILQRSGAAINRYKQRRDPGYCAGKFGLRKVPLMLLNVKLQSPNVQEDKIIKLIGFLYDLVVKK